MHVFTKAVKAIITLLVVIASLYPPAIVAAPNSFVPACNALMTGAFRPHPLSNRSLNQGKFSPFDYFVSIVNYINSIFPVKVAIPKKLGIQVTADGPDAQFNIEEGFIQIPANYSRQIDGRFYTKGLAATAIIFAHEYGHALFQGLLNSFTNFQKRRASVKKELSVLDQQSSLYHDKIESLKTRIFKTTDPTNKIKLNRDLKNLERDYDLHGEQLNHLHDWNLEIDHLVASYHEFFADVIALTFARSPDAFIESFHFEANQGKLRRAILSRDFRHRHRIAMWMEKDEHTFFAPVRFRFQKKIFSMADEADFQKVIDSTARAIKYELEFLVEAPGQDLPTHRELNLRLMRALEKSWNQVKSGSTR